ncbi:MULTISPECIES: hypothetical protein [Halobacteriovorax]|uniref:Lipoprotein n=1 Tax=Halobacteriovorax vibrionivorans TaxID=2152716 RepID=A0ABY0IDQ6_9BACT|nr:MULTISPECIES: hypothetical protein [Halobacteriovorax]RZF21085.1 hypothetical protein DAY19_13985 [Halobacteriovorax vibrionivorans]TGD47029.1 hypothetical protein EP118_09670 [Halobacteriovorax sp. Y22]
MFKAFLFTTLTLVTTIFSLQSLASCEQQDQNIAYKNTREFIRIKKVVNEVGTKKVGKDLKKQINSLFNQTRNYYFQSKCLSLRHQQLGILMELKELKKL